MKKSLIYILVMFAAILGLSSAKATAQNVKAYIDTNYVEFGTPVTLTITAEAPNGQNVSPIYQNAKYIVPTLEILGDIVHDTLPEHNGKLVHRFTHRITSFEDSTYAIPAFQVKVDTSVHYTNELSLTFTLLQGIDSSFYAGIDTTQTLKIFDVSDIKETPWTFAEFWERYGQILFSLLIFAAIISIITYVVVRKIRNQPLVPYSKPKEPAHVQALLMLNNLKDKKLCDEGKTKDYYTAVVEILKNYISDRWGTSVMESSTSETLAILKGKIGGKSVAFNDMKEISATADFVKFAKMEPSPEENLKTIEMAFEIVESTKQTEQEIMDEETVIDTPKFLASVKETLTSKYFDFRGRARRSEFWWMCLLNNIVETAIYLPMILIPNNDPLFLILGAAFAIWFLYTLVPSMGTAVRRLHDIGKKWTSMLIIFVPILGSIVYTFWLINDSQRGPNRWGISPKYPTSRNTEFLKED